MLKSMTAFGQRTSNTSIGNITVEIQSVNRKFLDTQIQLPKGLEKFETEIRKWLNLHTKRGKVFVRIQIEPTKESHLKITPNLTVANELHQAWQKIRSSLGYGQDDQINLELLSSEPSLFNYKTTIGNEDDYLSSLKQAFNEAIQDFLEMKNNEGKELTGDILERLEKLEAWVGEIEAIAQKSPEKHFEKLKGKLLTSFGQLEDNEDRALRELCIFSEKVDISEEITRFTVHLKRMRYLIENEKEAVGKELDFLTQELQRETNTMGSKTTEVEVSQRVVNMKTEIEKIREQLQNVE